MAESVNRDHPDVYFTKGACRITLKLGDLLKETGVDAIVIPTPACSESSDDTYPIFRAMRDSADERLKNRIEHIGAKIKLGEQPQIITENKPYVILTPIPYFGNRKKALQMLAKTYSACLDIADRNKCLSIAFPTMGCGNSGFSLDEAAKKLYETLDNQIGSTIKRLNDVRIIIYEETIYQGLTGFFVERGREPNAAIKPRTPSPRDEPITAQKPDAR
jgi:O-acetyl-ADP-ribose deacetylase (regulator of RNase III)